MRESPSPQSLDGRKKFEEPVLRRKLFFIVDSEIRPLLLKLQNVSGRLGDPVIKLTSTQQVCISNKLGGGDSQDGSSWSHWRSREDISS